MNITSIKQIEELVKKYEVKALLDCGFFCVNYTQTACSLQGFANEFPELCLDPDGKFYPEHSNGKYIFFYHRGNGYDIVLSVKNTYVAPQLSLQEALVVEQMQEAIA